MIRRYFSFLVGVFVFIAIEGNVAKANLKIQPPATPDPSLVSVEQRRNNPNPEPKNFNEIMKYAFKGKPMVGVGKTIPVQGVKKGKGLSSLEQTLKEIEKDQKRKESSSNIQVIHKKTTAPLKADKKKYIEAFTPVGGSYQAVFVQHFPSVVTSLHVLANRGLWVEEEFQTIVTDENFKFVRDIPLSLKLPFGEEEHLLPKAFEVQLNGQDVAYQREQVNGFERLTIGNPFQKITPGLHIYTIRYFIPDFIKEEAEYNRLFWTVFGKDLMYPIENTMVLVYFPKPAKILMQNGYLKGKKIEGFFKRVQDKYGNLSYLVEYPLPAHTPFSIDVAFSKGALPAFSLRDKVGLFLKKKLSFVIALLGMLIGFLYYAASFLNLKKQTKKVSLRRGGLSPLALQYALLKKLDKTSFALALISLASKGTFYIKETAQGLFLEKGKKEQNSLSKAEKALKKTLFKRKQISLFLSREKRESLESDFMKKAPIDLTYELNQKGFAFNQFYFYFGVGLFVATWIGMALSTEYFYENLLFSLLGCSLLLGGAKMAEESIPFFLKTKRKVFFAGALLLLEAGIVALSVKAFSLMPMFIVSVLCLPLMAGGIMGAYWLFRMPSSFQKEVKAMTEGYKAYLSQPVLEGYLSSKRKIDEQKVFEKHLPFAIALGVQEQWSARFKDLKTTPSWYDGTQDFSKEFILDLMASLEGKENKDL
ncbi:MAG: DUF2207 domain-containing protein [Alphaproteobacteria bacterium]|nr:DUF2207 domain-containing protein [Alphaproteobacteria bacterium]